MFFKKQIIVRVFIRWNFTCAGKRAVNPAGLKILKARPYRRDLASESHRLFRHYSNYSHLDFGSSDLAGSCVFASACVPEDDWAQEMFFRIRSCVAF